ncbi:MAG: hypothetical protein KDA32_06710 [Phycisphaerales bacterium]|nr:hypothetical protein [Phycisphaerales bacterium]
MSKTGNDVHEIRFTAYPKLLFIWPIIVAGFLLYPLAGMAPPDSVMETVIGWIYIMVLVFVLITLGVDVDRNQAIFLIVLTIALWLGAFVLENFKNVPVLSWIHEQLKSLDVRYDRGFGMAVAIILLIPFSMMLIVARFNDRWRITHNEFEHYSFGKMDDSLGRGAKSIRASFPDVFELVLGMAGTLIVYNATGTQELRRINNVMFLPLIRKKLNKILESTSVTAAMIEEDDDDA